MSKLPMESRPLRLAPEVQKVVEARLRPLSGKKLEAAQTAILAVYQSGRQMPHEHWMREYDQAITNAIVDS